MLYAPLIVLGLIAIGAPVHAQTLSQPVYTLIETGKPVYGRASQDFRGIGLIDYWWVGHQRDDGPRKALAGQPGRYAPNAAFKLPNRAVDGSNMDRHECGFLHLDDDRRIDMVCTVGADRGEGVGPNEVYRNESSARTLRMTRIEGAALPTGLEDPTGRHRTLEPFRFADGSQGLWSVVLGIPRVDGEPNINRLYRYHGLGSFKFTEVPSAPVNDEVTLSNCSRVGDLNHDGLDDLLLCRTVSATNVPADSLLYLQRPDGSFRLAGLPMDYRRFRTAEIVDMDGDGRQDLLVSIVENDQGRIELYLQGANGRLPREPTFRLPVDGIANSFAVGDLDGDGRPDVYVALAIFNECRAEYDRTGTLNDRWKDLVLSTEGAPARGFLITTMVNEPVAKGCSWLAAWGGTGIVHLGRGLEVQPGDSYSLRFAAAR